MRKCLLFVALLIVSQLDQLKAQPLFQAPDTVCVRQTIQLQTSDSGASSFYWGFCSGYLRNFPTAVSNLGTGFTLDTARAMVLEKDGGNYYGFVANYATSSLLRFDYGKSLANIPTVTNFGTMAGKFPFHPKSMYMAKDTASGNWFMFVCGGDDPTTSSLGRVDFMTSLSNTPNVVNFGNLNTVLNDPRGLFVAEEAGSWYGFLFNYGSNSMVAFDMGSNISLTPTLADEGNIGGLINGPTDMAAIYDAGSWSFFVTNNRNNSLMRIDMGSLTNTNPPSTLLGNPGQVMHNPSGIKLVRDCGDVYAFITNYDSSNIVELQMASVTDPAPIGIRLSASGSLPHPGTLSRIIRDHDNLYIYVPGDDGSLSDVSFQQCKDASLASSTNKTPPPFKYLRTGTYTVYFSADDGLPTMQAYCKQIYVEDIPAMKLTPDTLICQGDTARIIALSPGATSFTWSPFYNSTDTVGSFLFVHPAYSLTYNLTVTYPDGCIVDTGIVVNVSQVKADAGQDRTIADGSKTVLGGPGTTIGPFYSYTWTPAEYISNTIIPDPTVNPPYDFTYYLNVVELNDTLKCSDRDTVVVHVDCGDIALPNAFVPGSTNAGSNRFGILNREIIQLKYLRVYDRWGQQVFQTTDAAQSWDGNVNGDPAAEGVYVWEAEGFCINGKRVHRTGNVTLIR